MTTVTKNIKTKILEVIEEKKLHGKKEFTVNAAIISSDTVLWMAKQGYNVKYHNNPYHKKPVYVVSWK